MRVLDRLRRFWHKPWPDKVRAASAALHSSLEGFGRWAGYERQLGRPGKLRFAYGGRQWVMAHRGSSADIGVIVQCFADQQYEIPDGRPGYRAKIDTYYSAILTTGRVPLILDCGANIGASALWFRARFPQADIVAVEPAQDNLRLLKQNVVNHGIEVQAAAIGAMAGKTILADPGEGEWAYRTGGIGTSGYEVPMTSIVKILAEKSAARFEPFILKIDIEGAERSLFDSGNTAAARFPVIMIETHDWIFPGEGTASGFFRFHADAGRDILFHAENFFSIDYRRLTESRG